MCVRQKSKIDACACVRWERGFVRSKARCMCVRTKREKEENSSKLGAAAAQHIHLVGKPWFGDSSSVAQERNLAEVGRAPPSLNPL
mmetsp:Transcript_39672/g.40277  ORF Transcript_39672/g.40277 Transcript_39672/m.40277 type:complete len:86 (+) Transcript_39672:336-593(+)